MRRTSLYPLFAFFSFATGCATIESQVVARASHDFSCAREQTVITDQFGGIYRLEGCGFAASYECREGSNLRVACMPVEGTETVATRATTGD